MKKLLVDYLPFDVKPEYINESIKENNGKLVVRGVLQRAEAKNQNGRVYPKETLMREAKKFNAEIIPIDSEHCAIHQCLSNIEKKDIKKIIITCSGGPFLGKSLKSLKDVSARDALKHPVWKMGSKNLIDSASLMNKALEMIEAKWLFDLKSEQIDVIIHPQSIIHSMVETIDNSILSVMSEPDMKICIDYRLGNPNKNNTSSNQ